MILSTSHARTIGLITLSLSPLLPALTPSARATTIIAPEVHFKPDVGQPIFPAGNINIFKQFVLDWHVKESVGDSTSIPFLGTFGADISAELEMAFGLEMGLCFGGNATFDLGFQPTITLPDRYPTEVPIPLTVHLGFKPTSSFSTTFPPLGKAYADLIMHAEADLQAQACVFGCASFKFPPFSTCDIPALPDGTRLFKESVRCDPSLTTKKYCAIELASFNREDDNKARMLNVWADNIGEFLAEPYVTYQASEGNKRPFTADQNTDRLTVTGGFAPLYGGAPVKVSSSSPGSLPSPLDKNTIYYIIYPEGGTFKLARQQGSSSAVNLTNNGSGTLKVQLYEPDPPDDGCALEGRYGKVCISVPTVNTDSAGSAFNTCEVLKSTGAEDILSANLDVTALASDFLLPPAPFPRLADSDSIGPLSYHYTIASLDIGPSVQLQTDFEMTWDVVVTEMTFTVPGSPAPGTPRNVMINDQPVSRLTQVTPPRTYHLTNCGPLALPAVSLITEQPLQLPVEVNITYELRPKLKTVVSTPFFGNLSYKALEAGVDVDYVGGLGFGPLIEGDHKFKFGEFTVYNGNPSPINAGEGQKGTITFTMQGSGPPSFAWRPSQLGANSTFDWSQLVPPLPQPNGITNWREQSGSTPLMTGYPGKGGGLSSDVKIDPPPVPADNPTPSLYDSRTIASLQVAATRRLDLRSKSGAGAVLQVGGGLVENCGIIDVGPAAGTALWINSKDAVLCGPLLPDGTPLGTVLLRGSSLKGYPGPEPASFSNYNAIRGTGTAMDEWSDTRASTVNNMGIVTADGSFSSCNGLTLTLNFDDNPEQIFWDILKDGDTTVAFARGAPYVGQADRSTLVIPLTLPPGIYVLEMYDSGGDGLCCGSGNGSYSLRDSSNTVLASGSQFGFLRQTLFTLVCDPGGILSTSGTTVINQGTFAAVAETDGNLYGQKLDTRVSSRITADGNLSRNYLSFQQAEHAGLVAATNGGTVHVGPFYSINERSAWNAGQSFTNDVGYFRATGFDSLLEVQDADMTGGCFLASGGGAISAEDSTFTGSVFHIGDFNPAMIDPNSGTLTLSGTANRLYTSTCLSNYGTVNVPGRAEFVDNVMFSNNGAIVVGNGGILRIREKTMNTAAPGAAPETRVSPGAANATKETLIGGTWDVTGSLLIDGANFKTIGANAARAATTRGTVDGLGGSTGALEDDATRTLSLRNAGKVWLRGANWNFPALTTLEENRGSLCLTGGAVFPRTPVNTPGNLTNKGVIRIEAASRINVGGSYIQKGAHSTTDLITGSLVSSTNNFQILGGTLTANSASTVFNRSGTSIPAGTTIRVGSPLTGSNKLDANGQPVFDAMGEPVLEPVKAEIIMPGVQITTIAAGANVTVHGGAARFRALTENLTSNAGTFTVSGDGIDNAADVTLGTGTGDFINTGRVNVLGSSSELFCEYIQNGAAAVTEIGGGAQLRGNNVAINAGQLIMDIESRAFDGHYATIRASTVALNNKLVINFTGKLGVPGASVDTGDMWELMYRTVTNSVTGFGTVAYTFNGGALPADFLPPGTHLETIQWNGRGLGIRVVPNSGFVTYNAWAISKGYANDYRRNPFQDFDNNGRTNGQEFLFGATGPSNPVNGTVRDVTGADGITYREYLYVRAAGYHDAIFTPYASTDNVNWIKAPMLVMDISAIAGTALERVTLRSTLPATSDPVYYRVQAGFNPDNFADNSGLIPEKPINSANGLNVIPPYVAGQVLFFNVNARTPGNFDSVYGTNATGYGDWSGLPTACIHAGMVPAGSNGLVKVTFFPKLASYSGAPANGVTPQAPGNYPGANDPAGVSYRIASAAAPPLVNFISNNANLASLYTSEGTLTPEFSPAVTSYTLSVSRSVTSMTLTAAPSDGTATLRLNGVLTLLNGVASAPITLNTGTTGFTTTVTAQDGTANKSYAITVSQLPADYTVTTTGNAIVITDLAGFGDTLDISEPAAGNILFTVPGRSFQVNGGAMRTGDSGNLTHTGVTSITVNAGSGSDIINTGAFTGTLPALTINGGPGNDSLYFTGDITFAANASLNLDLQNDSATPGYDSCALSPEANLLTSGTGAITIKVSRTVKLNSLASLDTVNGGITVEAGLVSTSAALNAIDLNEGTLRSTGSGGITLVADSMILTGPVIAGAASTVTLRQKTNTTTIGLGANDVAGRLGLTDADLDFITAPNLVIGDTLTPALTISAPITRPTATALTLIANPATGTIFPDSAGTDLNLSGGTLTLGGTGAALVSNITGLTPDTQYSQLKVTGGVNLNSAKLSLTSSFAAAAGNVFTLVDNDGTDAIAGTFAGLPAASEFPWPGSANLNGRISYTGGTGNDVTVTIVALVTSDLIPRSASWSYLAPLTAAAAPALTWRNPGFAETGWSTGNAEIGYGDADEATIIPTASGRPFTVYFRKTFTVANPASFSALTLSLVRDDGAVVYLNGVEVWRTNMLELIPVTYATPASATAGSSVEEQSFYTRLLEPGLLVAGTNVLAVEVHQVGAASSDISFNAGLVASPGNPDSDGDGMPDAWENASFGNLAATAAGDTDGDGRSNLSEWKARTNPLNSLDAFVITSATANASRQTTLAWPTVPGVGYRVQRSTGTSGWTSIGTVLTGTGSPVSFTDTAPPAGTPRVIYRVVIP